MPDLQATRVSGSREGRQKEESHRGKGARTLCLYAEWKPLWTPEEIMEEVESLRGKLISLVQGGVSRRGQGEKNLWKESL